MTDRLYYFVHVPKTAGAAVRRFLYEDMPRGQVLFLGWQYQIDLPGAASMKFEDAVKLPAEELAKYRVFYGHFPFEPAWFIHDNCRGLAFVRDPMARIVSWFNYVGSRPRDQWAQNAEVAAMIQDEGLGLREVFERMGGIPQLDNGIVRQLTRSITEPVGAVGREHLDRAISNIEQHFDFVGQAAHFDASMYRIGELLGCPYRPIGKINVSPGGSAEDRIDEFGRPFLESLTELDRELVAFVQSRFPLDR